ncbi:MAG: Potassium efflux system KefA precursor [Candidatus Accumulibacter appositus]|uniref:Potassium efflux system KefA n=2 Tax=Candidatus Accumulibacter TaxID=327159 RepID=A0A011PZ81_9PROT|nr:MAG: Potassium efflux system KefA precursor [Candidatus Accumulibacter appositus]
MTLRRFLFALCILLLAPLADAQLTLPKQLFGASKEASKSPEVSTTDAVDPRAEAETLLAEARRRQEEQRLKERAATEKGSPASERQRLLDRLVLLYGERVKLLDELATLKNLPPETPNQRSVMAALSGPPPYSALRVDALRDEFDTLSEHLKSLGAAGRALEEQQAVLIEVRKRAGKAVRLAEDRLAMADSRERIDKDRESLELASLSQQQADADLSTVTVGRNLIQMKLEKLQPLREKMQRLLSRVLPEQRLSKEDFEQQQATLRLKQARVSAEIDQMVAENSKHATERERLAKLLTGADPNGPIAHRMQVLDVQMETDRLTLMTLTWLDGLLQTASSAWEQRFVGFSSDDPATRQTVLSALQRTSDELVSRQDLFREMQDGARTAVIQQALRLENTSLSSSEKSQEAAILKALEKRVQDYQRLEVAGRQLHRQINRWLKDFGFSGEAGDTGNWKLGALQVTNTLKQIWDFEMFAVEDSTFVDGKTVTVAYGVTVGKSIGAIVLYIVGYWLFSLLSARLQRLMVSRFHVDEQLASVIRRWSMIALALVLVIFILNLARIPLTVFAFMGGALAIGIGFGTQTIIKNVISGIIILFERKVRVGDIVAVQGMTGYVTQVDLRASTLRGFDGLEALVPNSSLLENQVINWTYSSAHVRREIRVGIAYGSPVHGAADIISGCADDHGQVLRDPKPEVFFEDFGDNALLLVLVFWVELGPNLMGRRVDSDLRYAMEKRLGTAGISIAFPQRDVHLDVSQPLPVRVTREPVARPDPG